MTKILLVISKYYPEYTGAAYRIDSMYRRLISHDPDLQIDVLCNSTSYMKSENYQHKGWNVQRCVFPWRFNFLPLRLRSALKTYYEFIGSLLRFTLHKPDLIHIVGNSGCTMAALLYFRWCRKPRIIELVTKEASPVQFLPGLRYKHKLALDTQTIVVAISQNLADNCKALGLSGNIWCRPNPIDEKRFFVDNKARDRLRSKNSPFQESDVVIGMVAKFMPQKNQIFLLQVLQRLPNQFKLLVAGPLVETGIFGERDGAYFQHFQNQIIHLNLQSRVHIHTGFVDASDYMKACDIYVMPQFNEGLGTPMLEAMACGLPVIANKDEVAFSEWIKESENGFLCELDANNWSEAIIKACQFSSKQRTDSSKHVLSLADATHIDQQYVTIIKQLILAKPEDTLNISSILKAS